MRADNFLITVTLDGRPLGVWDKWTGGEATSEETKYRPGGMQPHVSLGGAVTIENVTISKLATGEDDVHYLISRAGKGEVIATRQGLDADGNAFGRPLTYRGKLQRVAPAEIDSESSDPALLELEVAPVGAVG
jgi:hypothetical protein